RNAYHRVHSTRTVAGRRNLGARWRLSYRRRVHGRYCATVSATRRPANNAHFSRHGTGRARPHGPLLPAGWETLSLLHGWTRKRPGSLRRVGGCQTRESTSRAHRREPVLRHLRGWRDALHAQRSFAGAAIRYGPVTFDRQRGPARRPRCSGHVDRYFLGIRGSTRLSSGRGDAWTAAEVGRPARQRYRNIRAA